jgi:hypothetical protein
VGPRRKDKASDSLARFLEADDLDDLQKIRSELPELDQNDASVVRDVIQAWREPQAIANLLFNPGVIPPDIRVATVLRGLNEYDRRYLKLAAVVGLQSIQPSAIAPSDVAIIRDRLLQIIEVEHSIISSRASVSIETWLDSSTAPAVCRLLNHSNETVRNNLLAWLITHVDVVKLTPLLESSDLVPEKVRSVIRDADEYKRCRDAGVMFTRASSYLFSYIPNLSGFRDAENQT